MELCALAAEEQDPKKLIEIVAEITALLEAKERRRSCSNVNVTENLSRAGILVNLHVQSWNHELPN